MGVLDDLSKQVAIDTKVDINIVHEIIKNAFKSTVKVMKDEDDTRDILFNNLFKFKLKSRFKNNKKQQYR